jgi:hypothetical protein
MRAAALTLLAILVAAAPAAAATKTETASLGTVRAELSYVPHTAKPPTSISLKVFDADAQIVDTQIPDSDFFQPVGYGTSYKSVHVVDVDGDGVGEALFDLYTGGAHCCELTYLYKGATEIQKNWGDPGYKLSGNDFITGDDRFAYHFGSFAGTIFPLRVFRLQASELVDVTRDPAQAPRLRTELRRFRRYYHQAVTDFRKDPVNAEAVRSTVGALTADECSLGHCATGYGVARRAIAKHDLHARYLPKLKRFLKRLGYDG